MAARLSAFERAGSEAMRSAGAAAEDIAVLLGREPPVNGPTADAWSVELATQHSHCRLAARNRLGASAAKRLPSHARSPSTPPGSLPARPLPTFPARTLGTVPVGG